MTKDVEPFADTERFSLLCASGCSNYGKKWSCPPYAPAYSERVKAWERLVVFFFQAELAQFSYIKNDYLKIKAANSILKSRADKYLRHMTRINGSYISTGSCRLCKPCKCKTGEPCRNRLLMSYSFEAMGIDVNALVKSFFGKELLWYRKGCLPLYTSVVVGLLTNEVLTDSYIEEQYYKSIIT
ncbi:MAG: DUF2284 domain-containing protein [Eggerthellaceae bacterium]|nr:DUF2284 domain-containing protein [Eggerthellaceae bacterium]